LAFSLTGTAKAEDFVRFFGSRRGQATWHQPPNALGLVPVNTIIGTVRLLLIVTETQNNAWVCYWRGLGRRDDFARVTRHCCRRFRHVHGSGASPVTVNVPYRSV
jgi:hypothetical protein